ncbi:MAG: Cif family virulence factor [Anaerolineae bacterium]
MEENPADLAAVRAVLERFQDGYVKRDPERLAAFMALFSADAGLEIIGTGASEPGEGEWCLGPAMVRELVQSDWLGWGDLRLDLERARIHCRGEAAWLATAGTVRQHFDADKAYRGYLASAAEWAQGERPPEERLLRILLGGADTLYELRRGEEFVWPLRFSAVLTREADGWVFRQMQFAFPTTRWPQERITIQ